jgi:hypothetical protein
MKRARRRAVEAEVARLSADLEQITPHDLRIINLRRRTRRSRRRAGTRQDRPEQRATPTSK